MNKVIIMGRLTRDVEIRQTPNGIVFAQFSVAINRRVSKEKEQKADFISCKAWRQTAEFISKYFNKGSMIAIVGHLQTDSWEKDGKKHYSTTVIVEDISFTGSKHKSDENLQAELDNNGEYDYEDFADLGENEEEPPF
jgi:single-strand DNA-binding protein